MGSVEFGAELAAARRRRRWDQPTLGEEIAKLSAQKGQPRAALPKQTISLWETGQRWPEPWHAWLICVLFNMLPHQLHLETVVTPEVAARYEKAARSGSAVTAPSRPTDMAELGPVRDLERLARAVYGVHPVDAIAAADMQAMTDALIGQRGHVSNRLLLVKLHQHLDQLREMMGRAQTTGVHRELTWNAAMTAVVAGNTWQWVNDLGAAREVILFARQLAAEAGAGVVGAMADFAYLGTITCGQDLFSSSNAGVELLGRAERALAGGVDLCFSTILYAARGRQYATLGREQEADRDFAAAHRALSRWSTQPTGLFSGVDPTWLDVCQGGAALMLNRPAEAIVHYQNAVAASASWMVPTYQINLAAAYAQAGQAEQAAGLLMGLIEGARDTQTALLLKWIDGVVRRELRAFADVPTVKQLSEALVT